MKSCIYTGYVKHFRSEPVRNRFRYSIFMMYLDLSEMQRVFRGRALWSVYTPNIAWFRRRDYLGDPNISLDAAVRDFVQERLGSRPRGPIRMLTHLRYFGHNFNPVTFYYLFDRVEGRVESIVADITNTPWGERYSYVLDIKSSSGNNGDLHFKFAKSFHVSPFMAMDMKYDWRFNEPAEELHVRMVNYHRETKLFTANLDMKRMEINGRSLNRLLLSYPPMTLKVVGGIYWQALKLWIKGATFYAHPETPGSK
ncbi:MAG: DUF1365 domain-containing protein [Acidobacteriota bacterium]